MDQPVEVHPNLAKLFPLSNVPPSVDAELEQLKEDDRLPSMITSAPTAPTLAPSSPPSHSLQNNCHFNLPNLHGSLPPLGPLLFSGACFPGSMRPRMPSAMDFIASGSGQQPPMFPNWTTPMTAGLPSQMFNMLFARNLAIAAANSNLFAQSQSAMSGGLTVQQLASAMDSPQTAPQLTKADALVSGPSSNNRGDFEMSFYSQSSAVRRSDDFVRHVDDAATATAQSMVDDDRRCITSESSTAARKLTPTLPSYSSPDSKNWKGRPVPIVPKKLTSSTSNWRSGVRDVRRVPFELRGSQQQQRDRDIRPSTEHSPGPSGDSIIVAHDAPRAPSKVVSMQPTDASGGGMLVSRRTVDGHLDVRVVYVREFVLQCAASPYTSLPPPNLSTVVLEMNEIVAKFPGRFQPARYVKQRHVSQLDYHPLHRRV